MIRSIAAYAMGMKEFADYSHAGHGNILAGASMDRFLYNQNKLSTRGRKDKTGWTTPAGRRFVGSFTQWPPHLCCFKCAAIVEDTVALLITVYNEYQYKCILEEGSI